MVYVNKFLSAQNNDRLPDPLSIVELVYNSHDISSAWQVMSERLIANGYDTCAMGIAQRSNETPFGDGRSIYQGVPLIDTFIQECIQRPYLQSLSPGIQQARRYGEPKVKLGQDFLLPEKSWEHESFNRTVQSIGLKGGLIVPFYASHSDCLIGVGMWCTDDMNAFEEKWHRESQQYLLSIAYFAETLHDVYAPFDAATEPLSPRERECLLWVAAGRRTAEIADILNLADATVNEYLSRAMRKLGASSRSQACAKAVIQGLFTP